MRSAIERLAALHEAATPGADQAARLRYLVALGEAVEGMPPGAGLHRRHMPEMGGRDWYVTGVGNPTGHLTPLAALEEAVPE